LWSYPLSVKTEPEQLGSSTWCTLTPTPPCKPTNDDSEGSTTTSYGAIARRIGNPTAARAVGAAVGKNPLSFVVPCHRVLGKSGDITGYHWGLTRKRSMLAVEAARAAA